MGVLAGPFLSAAALLALGGALKARRPGPTARALVSAGLRPLAPLARPLGVAEVAAGIGALAAGGPVFAALVAAFYAGFAGFVALTLLRAAPVSDCGCFGGTGSPPSAFHLVLNLAAAGVAAAVALGGGGGLADAVADQPLAGVPFVLLVVVCTGFAYAILTVLPRTLAAAAAPSP
ncbi:MAG: MauE/DoxX family redox-associated membrane protein [Acidimicrobiales bacterium]